ncbi:ATP-binding cassette domain-containing protein [Cloacibacillus evryensis]|uniref:ATP-binding cassette domain-containing protein n=1 Tax=Cloacibacillus evryensis TaxID=508460 RepID=A0AAW5K0T6_9BACT|nr:ATP-binding cassette domain-containing protein [Cloacibacillus evryensis]MCQ4814440.1 ATP-binding cassette domain-containing protein [Cloacibacillus evryensis]
MIQERQFILKGAEFCYPNASEKILKGIDLEIRAGEWVALLGSNGSGKSTLLKLLSALLIPTQGLCFVGGTDTSEAKGYELRGISAIVFQNPEDQIVASTVEEEVAFGPENLGCPPEEILARLEEALAATGLGDRREQLVASLSGGQKQRLALAGALAMHPKAILLDEAMSMLDPRSRRDFTEIIAAEHKKGLTIVEVTHRLDEIRGADRVIVLADGVISTDVSAKEFFKKSEAELLAMNLTKPPLDRLHERLVLDGLIPAETAASVEGIEEKLLCR